MGEERCDGVKVRGANGRFLSTKTSQPAANEVRRHGIKKRKERNHSLLYGYINAFFLRGDKQDFIPVSSRSGPFVTTYEKIMKPTFTVGRTNRSGILKEFYSHQSCRGISSKVARITVKDLRFPKRKPSRVFVYRYRRMPRLTGRRSEIDRLKAFLQRAENENSLAVSREVAYRICCEAMGTYRADGGKMAYFGFPAAESQESASPESINSVLHDRTQSEMCQNPQDGPVILPLRGEEGFETSVVQSSKQTVAHETNAENGCRKLLEDENELLPPCRIPLSPRSAKYFRQAIRFLKLARSNSVFEVLNKILDDRDTMLDFTTIPFALLSLGDPKVPNVPKDTLTHCEGRGYFTKNQSELHRIKSNLREVRDTFAKVRQIYGMK